jgi:hypothetical protein
MPRNVGTLEADSESGTDLDFETERNASVEDGCEQSVEEGKSNVDCDAEDKSKTVDQDHNSGKQFNDD